LWGQKQVVYQLATSHETLAKKIKNNKKKTLSITSSIAICERGFFLQNSIKSHLRASLQLDTLYALMQVLLCGISWRIWIGGQYLNNDAT
jgi:hypothetical protein